ncbi:TrkH family potassium uptake protein [Corynebacterium comes]|uniref:Ktr system potassium uptake protein B n=1 Tax=Corynebacterium comes TaxID=2675218 RepID=A0A6B8VTR3_9CORY|nr:potassium transporter TrkG [Corynebacterium comes]QGU04764.1 Ktr system potassium uptake protein B [Corynebacterium comes]
MSNTRRSHLPHLRPTAAVALGFLAVILSGATVLASPWGTAAGRSTPLVDALFTATSAVSLTGLVTVDTASHWSTLGQVTILLLIQIGGLGFMTLASLLGLLLAGRLGLRRRLGATAEGRGIDLGDVVWVIRATIAFSLIVEATIACVLAVRFHTAYEYSWGRAAWEGTFHSVSGFNNAGFALYSDNVMGFALDAWILLPLAFALIIGGIGFPVLLEAVRRTRAVIGGGAVRRWSLTARFTFVGTVVLGLAGTALVGLGEWDGALAQAGGGTGSGDGPGAGVRLLNAFFAGVSPRTAGFNALDYADFHPSTLLGTDLLMFIGGGSGGTAGGVKITTAAVLVAAVVAETRGDNSVAVHGRAISGDVVRQALVILTGSVTLVFGSTMAILFLAPTFTTDQVAFEVISAFATVGLSTGITPDLPVAAKLLLAVLMFAGRVGPLALATALAARTRGRCFDYPEERPFIG